MSLLACARAQHMEDIPRGVVYVLVCARAQYMEDIPRGVVYVLGFWCGLRVRLNIIYFTDNWKLKTL